MLKTFNVRQKMCIDPLQFREERQYKTGGRKISQIKKKTRNINKSECKSNF